MSVIQHSEAMKQYSEALKIVRRIVDEHKNFMGGMQRCEELLLAAVAAEKAVNEAEQRKWGLATACERLQGEKESLERSLKTAKHEFDEVKPRLIERQRETAQQLGELDAQIAAKQGQLAKVTADFERFKREHAMV